MKFKAQGLVELGLVLAFIVVIAIASFSPIGTKIKDSLTNMSPQKKMVISSATLNTLTKSQANTDKLTADIATLQNSSNITSKEAATFIKDTISIASKIATEQNSSITTDEALMMAKSMKKVEAETSGSPAFQDRVETSGSLASLIAVNVNTSALSADELAALNDANEMLNDTKIVINTGGTPLAVSIDSLISSLSGINASELLKFDMSPVTKTITDINAVKDSFSISASPQNVNVNVVNSVLLAGNIINSSSPLATTEIKAQAQKVIDEFRASLVIQ